MSWDDLQSRIKEHRKRMQETSANKSRKKWFSYDYGSYDDMMQPFKSDEESQQALALMDDEEKKYHPYKNEKYRAKLAELVDARTALLSNIMDTMDEKKDQTPASMERRQSNGVSSRTLRQKRKKKHYEYLEKLIQ